MPEKGSWNTHVPYNQNAWGAALHQTPDSPGVNYPALGATTGAITGLNPDGSPIFGTKYTTDTTQTNICPTCKRPL
jgi:hypothetical protein